MIPRWFVIGLLTSAVVAAWILAGPLLGLPFGVVGSTGDSMGDDGMVLNVWVDTEPDVGDVVIFEAHSEATTHDRGVHRIVDETENGYVTQGDANEFVDQELEGVPYATEENTVGVVVARVPL